MDLIHLVIQYQVTAKFLLQGDTNLEKLEKVHRSATRIIPPVNEYDESLKSFCCISIYTDQSMPKPDKSDHINKKKGDLTKTHKWDP